MNLFNLFESTDPCWSGYHQIGQKTQDGRSVPNCVPVEGHQEPVDEVAMNPTAYAQSIDQAERQGVLVGFEFEVCLPDLTKDTAGPDAEHKKMAEIIRNNSWALDLNFEDMRDLERFDQLFRLKPQSKLPRPVPYTSMKAAVLASGQQRLDKIDPRAEKIFYRIPERLRTQYVAQAYAYAKEEQFLHKTPLGKRMLFCRILKNLISGYFDRGSREAVSYGRLKFQINRDLEDLLNLYEQDYHRDHGVAIGVMFGTDSRREQQRIIAHMDRWFDFDPQAVYQGLGLADEYGDESYDDYDDAGPRYRQNARLVATRLQDAMGTKVKIFNNYHAQPKKLDRWYIEPDGSLTANRGDAAMEIVGPPEPPMKALDSLKKFYDLAKNLKFYTNRTTGLHINVSIPEDLDVLKLAVFTGDQYVLQKFGRENNDYARSVIQDLTTGAASWTKQGIGKAVTRKNAAYNIKLSDIQRIASAISGSHTASISYNGHYVSFRHAGGDYLSSHEDVIHVVGRFVRAMVIAADPTAHRQEYLKAVAQLVQPALAKRAPGNATARRLDQYIALIHQQGLPLVTTSVCQTARQRSWQGLALDNWDADAICGVNDDSVQLTRNSAQARQRLLAMIKPDNPGLGRSGRATVQAADAQQAAEKIAEQPISHFAEYTTLVFRNNPADYKGLKFLKPHRLLHGDGFACYTVEWLPATDPRVHQLLLNLRRQRFGLPTKE